MYYLATRPRSGIVGVIYRFSGRRGASLSDCAKGIAAGTYVTGIGCPDITVLTGRLRRTLLDQHDADLMYVVPRRTIDVRDELYSMWHKIQLRACLALLASDVFGTGTTHGALSCSQTETRTTTAAGYSVRRLCSGADEQRHE
ncbi:hypothetical protein TRAPUB_5358 [Trametes pubescens]|uniref:Uncharacterized protein n=1 Tax=Trametes pubescens TaxID=154538 RepID=A0A1M2V8S7_TRAPU|nr:hypothetical protein TRAPUB_5358 [Trametes pubescens]